MYIYFLTIYISNDNVLTASGTGGVLSYAGPPGDSGTANKKKPFSLYYLILCSSKSKPDL